MKIADCRMRLAKGEGAAAKSESGAARRNPNCERGFTMVEIAFSLAIVAFALVAIMGVLPAGMSVQKDNHDDTIINNDGQFWLEALKSGSRGLDDLTNYVEAISITNKSGGFEITNSFTTGSAIYSGEQIVRLFTTNHIASDGSTNQVLARVRAINGAAVEKVNPTNDFTFRYQMQVERIAISDPKLGTIDTNTVSIANYHEFRLTMRWPLFQQGAAWLTGRNKKVVRGSVNAAYGRIWLDQKGKLQVNSFLEPNTYAIEPSTNKIAIDTYEIY